MLNIKLLGDSMLEARFRAMPEALRRGMVKEVSKQTLLLEALVKRKVSGEVLRVRTGNLRASIHSTMKEGATEIKGTVASSGDVKYAAIHEFGGKTAPHIIEAKGRALAFMMGGKQVFAKRVNHPGSTMPERSFLRSSLRDRRDPIVTGLQKAAAEAMAKK